MKELVGYKEVSKLLPTSKYITVIIDEMMAEVHYIILNELNGDESEIARIKESYPDIESSRIVQSIGNKEETSKIIEEMEVRLHREMNTYVMLTAAYHLMIMFIASIILKMLHVAVVRIVKSIRKRGKAC